MKLFVTGGKGMLGRTLRRVLTDVDFVIGDLPECDITNAAAILNYGAGTQKSEERDDVKKNVARLIASGALLLVLMYFSMGRMIGLPLPPFLQGLTTRHLIRLKANLRSRISTG